MNILKFIESFTNEGVIQSLQSKGSRRDSLSQFGKIGANTALAAVPLVSMFFTQKANAASSAFLASAADTPISALQLALTLEYLEDDFYQMALDTNGLIPDAEKDIIAQISQHEAAHVAFLMGALGDDAPAKPEFDFTANGTFDTFDNYQTFLALSQAFEDTGVRAYKGQAANLMSNGDLLTAGLQIHSVEARHASMIRRLRGQKGWIVGNSIGTLPDIAAIHKIYDGEENTVQGGYNTTTAQATNGPALSGTGATEAFDEPISGALATEIASVFFAM